MGFGNLQQQGTAETHLYLNSKLVKNIVISSVNKSKLIRLNLTF